MIEFQTLMLVVVGSFFGCIALGIILGLLVPPSQEVLSGAGTVVGWTAMLMLAVGAVMVVCMLAFDSPFKFVPYRLVIAILAFFTISAGFARGASLRLHKRWT